MRLNGMQLQQATGGVWHKGVPAEVSAIATDTRQFPADAAFLALRGPHFDGHAFAGQVAGHARALIGDRDGMHLWKQIDLPQLEVADTLRALGDIAHAWRMQLTETTLVAISGSYGKTTLRSMLQHLFTALGLRTAATQANLNNLVGVPATLLSVPSDAEIALIECGISEQGEMAELARIVTPDIAVLTGIGAAHGAGLGGAAGVAREKALLLTRLQPEGTAVLGAGVHERLREAGVTPPPGSIDSDHSPLAVAWHLQGRKLTLQCGGAEAELVLALPASHWAADMALAATIALHVGRHSSRNFSLAGIASAMSNWQPVAGRMQLRTGPAGATLLDDAYNANPASMQAALDTLAAIDGRHTAILGDMAELGADAESAHAELRIAAGTRLMLVGPLMRALHAQRPEAQWFADCEALLAWLQRGEIDFGREDTILIKGSRSMELDRAVNLLASEEAEHAL